MALGVGFQHLRHAGQVAFPCSPEKRKGFRIDAQMHVGFARRGGLGDHGVAPEILAQLNLGRVSRCRLRQALGPHPLDPVERRLLRIVVCHSLLPSTR